MRPRILLTLWLLSDLALFVGSYTLAYFLRVGWILSTDFPFEQFCAVACLVSLPWIVVLGSTGTFSLTRNQWRLKNLQFTAYASLVGVALFTLAYYFSFEQFFSRLLLVYAAVISTAVIFVWHGVYQWIIRSILRRNPPAFPTLIIGVTRESKELITDLNATKNPLTPVAILDGRGAKESEIDGVPVLGKLNKLEEVLTEKGITHLIQCSDLEQSLNLLGACRQKKIKYMLLPSVLGIVERDEKVQSLEGKSVVVVDTK